MNWKTLLAALLALLLHGILTGCGPKAESNDEWMARTNQYAEIAERWGLEFRADGTYGDGHFLGQAFNFLGAHGSWHLSGKPIRTEGGVLPQPIVGAVK